MKILAIRGRNLASLAGDFALDFRAEPLASAGLYAICGPTGAGKSTLLDALCVALYERTPRLSRVSSRSEAVPDVADVAEVGGGGERGGIAAGDARTLLRRGAGEGYAEVDFVGGDGVAYRARWSVRRARARANGKLQASEVALTRIDDTQLVGDHRKSETLKLIESKVGLSFEQFTRAVLLAQNDFATFLKASDDERAELLQTLTGSGAFADISMRAYARMKAEKAGLERLETQLAGSAPWPAELRAQNEGELQKVGERLALLDNQRRALDQALRWYAEQQRLAALEAQAGQALDAARAAHAATAGRTRQLARIDAVQPARPLCADLVRLAREVAAGESSVDARGKDLSVVRRSMAEREAELAQAGTLLKRAEEARAHAAPQIDAAKALDARLAALAPPQRAACQAYDALRRQVEAMHGKRAATQTAWQGALDERAAAERWLSEHGAQQGLAEQWPRWETLFAQALALQSECTAGEQQTQALAQTAVHAEQALLQAQAQHVQRQDAVTTARADLAARVAAWRGFDGERLAQRAGALAERRDALNAAAALSGSIDALRARQRDSQRQWKATAQTIAQCDAELLAGEAQRAQLEPRLAAAENALQLAQLAASQGAATLRAALQDGAPCPVCGSLEHPYTRAGAHAAPVDAMLAALRENVAASRQALADVLARQASQRATRDATQQQAGRLADEIASVERALVEQARAWGACVARLRGAVVPDEPDAPAGLAARASSDSPLSFASPDVLETPGTVDEEARGGWVAAQQARVAQALEAHAASEAAYRAAGRQRDAAQARVDAAQPALDAAQQALARAQSALATTRQALEGAQQRGVQIATHVAETLHRLDAAFTDARWRDDWRRDAPALVARCRQDADDWLGRRKRVGDLAAQIEALKVVLTSQHEACAKAAADAAAALARRDAGEAQLQALRGERLALFAGRPVKEVEAELAGAVDAARDAQTRGQNAWQAANAECARLDEALRQAGAALAQQRQALAVAQQRHAAWLASFNGADATNGTDDSRASAAGDALPLTAEVLDELLAFDADWIAEERTALQQLQQAVDSAQSVLAVHAQARRTHAQARPTDDIAGAASVLADATPGQAGSDDRQQGEQEDGDGKASARLADALVRIEAAIAAAGDAAARLRGELFADDLRRNGAQALVAQIDAQQRSTRVWSQLGELIGSADGKKFRNFAQQLTLDVLLGYANRHLESLSRRYRLERVRDSLGLLVVDQDMGDELRSVHSLSGGESFLVSLALALGLASLSSHRVRVESLFIDEGFGSLDADALRVAMDALDSLQAQGRRVGVISHVAEMTERIGVRVQVTRQSGGLSRIAVG